MHCSPCTFGMILRDSSKKKVKHSTETKDEGALHLGKRRGETIQGTAGWTTCILDVVPVPQEAGGMICFPWKRSVYPTLGYNRALSPIYGNLARQIQARCRHLHSTSAYAGVSDNSVYRTGTWLRISNRCSSFDITAFVARLCQLTVYFVTQRSPIDTYTEFRRKSGHTPAILHLEYGYRML
jgi:hypothetical protein